MRAAGSWLEAGLAADWVAEAAGMADPPVVEEVLPPMSEGALPISIGGLPPLPEGAPVPPP